MVLTKVWEKLLISIFIAFISVLSQLETVDDILIISKDVALAKPPIQAFEFVTNLEEYSTWFPNVIKVKAIDNEGYVEIGKVYKQSSTYLFGISETTSTLLVVGYASPSYFEYLTDSFIQQKDVINIESMTSNRTKLNWRIYSRRKNLLFKICLIFGQLNETVMESNSSISGAMNTTDQNTNHLVALMLEETPFLIKTKNGTYEGYCVDLMNVIAAALNFTYEIRIPDDKKYGTYDNGEWNGMMKELLDGSGDIISGAFTITSERSKFVDFTVPFYGFAGMTLIMKQQKTQDDLFSFAKVFSWQVWVAVLIITIGMGFLVFVFENLSPFSSLNTTSHAIRQTQPKFNIKESMWLSFGTITLSGADCPPHTISTRVLLTGFWVFSSILLMTYNAILSASSTISRLDTSITSLQDLAIQHKVKYSCVSGTTAQTYFEEMSSIEQTFYEFWKTSSLLPSSPDENCEGNKLSNCKWRYYYNRDTSVFGTLEYKSLWEYPLSNTYTVLLKRIQKEGFLNSTADGINKVLASTNDDQFALISDYPTALYETNLNCDLQIVGNQFSSRPYALGLRKGSNLRNNISDVILGLQRDLVLDVLKTKWWGKRSTNCKSDTGSSLIKLNKIGGAFIIMAGAIMLAFFILCLDILNKRVKFKAKPSKLSVNNNLHSNIDLKNYKNEFNGMNQFVSH